MRNLCGLFMAGCMAVGLVVSGVQDVRAADRKQAAGPAMEMPKGKEFVNKSPGFSFIYPREARG